MISAKFPTILTNKVLDTKPYVRSVADARTIFVVDVKKRHIISTKTL